MSPLGRKQELVSPQSEEKSPRKCKRNIPWIPSQARWVPAVNGYAVFAHRAGKGHTGQILVTFSYYNKLGLRTPCNLQEGVKVQCQEKSKSMQIPAMHPDCK